MATTSNPFFFHPKGRALRCVVQLCLIFESADKDEFVSYIGRKLQFLNYRKSEKVF